MLDIQDYIKEKERQLHKIQHHKPLPNVPTKVNNETIHNVLTRLKKRKSATKKYCWRTESIKSKNHAILYPTKNSQGKNFPGRSVINSVNYYTLKTLENVDYHLQPIVKEISS